MALSVITQGARGGGLTLAGSLTTMLLQVVSVVALSRLLSPDDFGVVAMAGVFLALGNLMRDFGMPLAALQAKSLTHQQASNLFWVNVCLATTAAGLLSLCAPLLVAIYSEPRLAAIIPTLSIAILISGVSAQIQVDLARRMKFTSLVVTEVSGQAGGLALAVVLASMSFGYWALIAQTLAATTITLVGRGFVSRWRPLRFRRGHGSYVLVRTGGELGLAQLLTFLQNNADSLIIGVRLGPIALGYYNRGFQLLAAPAGRLLDPLTQVVIPTLNQAREQGQRYEPLLLRIQFLVGCATAWLFAITAGTAPALVPLALGPGWEPTIRVFQVLAIGGTIATFSHISYWAFLLNSLSRELLHYNLVSKPIAVACIAGGSLLGLEGVAWGYVAAMAISWPLNLVWLRRKVALPARDFAENGLLILTAGAVAGACGLLVTDALSEVPELLQVAVAGLGATAAMALFLLVAPRTRGLLRASTATLVALMRSRGER